MKEHAVFLTFSLLTLLGFAQSDFLAEGKYVGKFDQGGFVDSLIIQGDSLTHVLNSAWGYGVEHLFIYRMHQEDNGQKHLEQICHLIDRKKSVRRRRIGSLSEQNIALALMENGNLTIVFPEQPDEIRKFERIRL